MHIRYVQANNHAISLQWTFESKRFKRWKLRDVKFVCSDQVQNNFEESSVLSLRTNMYVVSKIRLKFQTRLKYLQAAA